MPVMPRKAMALKYKLNQESEALKRFDVPGIMKFWVKKGKRKSLNVVDLQENHENHQPHLVRWYQIFMHRPIQPHSWSSSYSSRCRSLSTLFINFQQAPQKIICSLILPTMRNTSISRRLCMERRRRRTLGEYSWSLTLAFWAERTTRRGMHATDGSVVPFALPTIGYG